MKKKCEYSDSSGKKLTDNCEKKLCDQKNMKYIYFINFMKIII